MAEGTGIARITFLGFRADVGNALSLVATSIIVARGLGPADRGLFFLAFLVATLVALIADCGLSATSIVFGANGEIPSRQLNGVALALSTTAALVAATVFLPFQDFWTDGVLKGLDTTLLVILCVGIMPLLYSQVLTALLTGMGHVPEVSAMRNLQSIVYPVLITPAALSGDPRWALAAWLGTVVFFAVALAVLAVRHSGPPARPTGGNLRRVFSFGGRSWIGTLSHQGFLRVDVLFLSGRYGPGVVGVYSLASVIAEKISLVGHAMYGASAAPIGRGGPEAAGLTAATVRMMFTLLVPVAVVLAALAAPGFPLIFGEGFGSAALPFAILLPGTIALAVWYLVGLFIVSALRRPGTTALIQGSALLASLPLYYFAVRWDQMTGAAIVSSATYISVLAVGLGVLVRNTDVRLRDLVPGAREPAKLVELLRTSISPRARA